MPPQPQKAHDPAPDELDAAIEADPLVQRLREMQWPEPDAETRERCLQDFQRRLDERG